MPNPVETVTLPTEKLDKLTEQMTGAIGLLDKARTEMNDKQKEIGEVVGRMKTLEEAATKRNTDGGTELSEFKGRLEKLAASVQALAEQNTNLLTQIRNTSNVLVNQGTPVSGYRYRGIDAKGAFFESRRQAVELGYFFMATDTKGGKTRQYAQNWLKREAGELRYLPNLPRELVQHLAAEQDKVIERCFKQGFEYATQDLATNVTPGSVLVFPTFANTFIRNVEEFGAFRQNALVWPMGGDTVYIPRRSGGVSVYWVGEASTTSETDPSFEMLMMVAKKSMAMHQFSRELQEDENAAIALADIIMFEFSLAWAGEEDRIGFTGTGAGGNSPGFAGFKGVLGITGQAYVAEASEDRNAPLKYDALTGLDRTDEVTLKGIRTMIGICHTWALPGAKWYAHRTVLQDLYGIETTGGGPITSSDVSGRTQLLAYPTVAVEKMPASPGTASTAVFAFGDLRKGWILGDRRAPELQTSEHYAFNTDQLTLRFSSRVAFLPAHPPAMVQYVTAA